MTFLELCQNTRVECGIAGNSAGNTPVDVSGQTGELLRVVTWVKDAYEDIQLKNGQWDFMRNTFSFNAVVGTGVYARSVVPAPTVLDWKPDSLRLYLTVVNNEQWLDYTPWDSFRDTRLLGASAAQQGRPIEFTVKPDRSLQLWPRPDQTYTITGEYFRVPHVLTANGDTPLFDLHHKAIVWNAVMRYAAWSGEPSLYAQAQKEYNRLVDKLEALYLPKLALGAAFA